MSETPKVMRANCYNCGRFVGKDGDLDLYGLAIGEDGVCAGWEPECRRCIEARHAARRAMRSPGARP